MKAIPPRALFTEEPSGSPWPTPRPPCRSRFVLPLVALPLVALHLVTSHPAAAASGPKQVWSYESDVAGAKLGAAVAGAGDVNGDGFADLLVGAPSYGGIATEAGQVLLFLGSATGLPGTPSWHYDSKTAGDNLGAGVSPAGDVNNDGFDDFIVGAPYLSHDSKYPGEGAVLLFLGSESGPGDQPDSQIFGEYTDANLGYALAGVGDANGDGYDDILVGGFPSGGGAILYAGNMAGSNLDSIWYVFGEQPGALLGSAVGGGGDINGDGLPDLIVGADLYDNPEKDEGLVRVFFGSTTSIHTTPDWILDSNQSGAYFGNAVADAGDINKDGFADVLIGAFYYDDGEADEGAAFLFNGSSTPTNQSTPGWKSTLDRSKAHWGQNVAGVHDLNDDGYNDILIGTSAYSNGQSNEGLVALYYGSSSAPAAAPDWSFESNVASAQLGISLAYVGDVDNNGCLEFAVGANNYANGQTGEGEVLVFQGTGKDGDGDGYCSSPSGYGDCNDSDPASYPGATEIPGDGIDQDCDTKENCYVDNDGDGFRNTTHEVVASSDLTCPASAHLAPASAADTDCNDADEKVNPDATEVCDTIDNNCNGKTDEEVTLTFYLDADQDGYGDVIQTRQACTAPQGYVADSTDCDDTREDVNPGATEVPADGIDEDCDTKEKCYVDADGDGYRPDVTTTKVADDLLCTSTGLATATAPANDCDDANAAINPGALESCNLVDDDCSGVIDNSTPFDCKSGDFDGDGYTELQGDCNDQDGKINPIGQEICDGIDNDCDGSMDEGDVCATPDPGDGASSCSCDVEGSSSRPLAGLSSWLAVVTAVFLRRRRGRASTGRVAL